MRLSSVLSEPPKPQFDQVEAIVDRDRYTNFVEDESEELTFVDCGDFIELNIGKLVLPFFCTKCNDNITFTSTEKLHCLLVNKQLISIDCFFNCFDKEKRCIDCNSSIQAWFLVEIDDVFSNTPKVRIIKRNFKLLSHVKFPYENGDNFSEWLEKADFAYKERLGAGAIVYLRTVFEKITHQVGIESSAEIYDSKGKLKPFEQVLKTVDEKCSIIPHLYSKNGYDLFRKLSDIVHGKSDEQTALDSYKPLKRLVLGIIDNIEKQKDELKNNSEIVAALRAIGVDNVGGTNE